MKNLLKKLNIVANQAEEIEGSNSSKNSKLNAGTSPLFEHNKPFNALAGWFQSVTNKKSSTSPFSSSNDRQQDRIEEQELEACGLNVVGMDVGSESSNSKDPDIEEEYQIQLAMEMSAREDPEAAQIEAVKQISLGSFDQENTPAEVVAYRYWVCI